MSDVYRDALRLCEVQRDKLNAVIVALSRLIGDEPAIPVAFGPSTPPLVPSKPVRAAVTRARAEGEVDAKILSFLSGSPAGTGKVVEHVGLPAPKVKRLLRALADRGLVLSTGVTSGQKWHRQPGKPAKEAP